MSVEKNIRFKNFLSENIQTISELVVAVFWVWKYNAKIINDLKRLKIDLRVYSITEILKREKIDLRIYL